MKKAIISILFLLVYSIGFAHNVIPHHSVMAHSDVNVIGEEHQHKHHTHSATEMEHDSHEHISHANHYDHGWYDLLVCLLDDVEHSDDTSHIPHNLLENNQKIKTNKLGKAQVAIILASAIGLNLNIGMNPGFMDSVHFTIYPPFLKHISRRGPPSV